MTNNTNISREYAVYTDGDMVPLISVVDNPRVYMGYTSRGVRFGANDHVLVPNCVVALRTERSPASYGKEYIKIAMPIRFASAVQAAVGATFKNGIERRGYMWVNAEMPKDRGGFEITDGTDVVAIDIAKLAADDVTSLLGESLMRFTKVTSQSGTHIKAKIAHFVVVQDEDIEPPTARIDIRTRNIVTLAATFEMLRAAAHTDDDSDAD